MSDTLRFAGLDFVPDPTGALFWPEAGVLAVADLHLEKGSKSAARGHPLPPYDTRVTLDRLEDALNRLKPVRVICLGDSFHDLAAGERMAEEDGERLRRLCSGFDWLWIAGNHDPEPPHGLSGRTAGEHRLGPVIFRHAARNGAEREISGHLHPIASVPTRVRRVRGRCFVTDGVKLILPAFGAYAGGLDVRDPAIHRLLRAPFEIHLLAGDRVHRFPGRLVS